MAESLVLKVCTVDGKEYNVRVYIEGAKEKLYAQIPREVANGVWSSDGKTFIPGTAIARVELLAGSVGFPQVDNES